jgi:hypothetical protein
MTLATEETRRAEGAVMNRPEPIMMQIDHEVGAPPGWPDEWPRRRGGPTA